MEVDKVIKKAIEEAVAAEKQPTEVAKKITTWVSALADANEDANSDGAKIRLDALFDSVVISSQGDH